MPAAHLDAGLGRFLHGLEQVVVRRFPVEREGRVDNPPIDVHSKVDLQDILRLKDCKSRDRSL